MVSSTDLPNSMIVIEKVKMVTSGLRRRDTYGVKSINPDLDKKKDVSAPDALQLMLALSMFVLTFVGLAVVLIPINSKKYKPSLDAPGWFI